MAASYAKQLVCGDCPTPISDQNKSGFCRRCTLTHLNNDVDYQERRVAAIRKRYESPEARAKAAREIAQRHRIARQDPEKAARLNRNLAKARARLNEPEVRAAFLASREQAGKKRHETVMAWCPEEYRGEYFHLCRTKRLSAAEAKRVILDQIAATKAAMSPFERQAEAVRNGAGLAAKPRFTREYDFTLAGGSPL